jgi:hypothetical protein
LLFGEFMSEDRTRKPAQINPPNVPTSIMLWRAMWVQSNVVAGLSGGPDEKAITEQNNDKAPSELERMKKATEDKKP